ncbi:RHS repeat-associated core domain-containing protein [Niallia hominis]|uniref:RHS repeat-associated core domain-containing protein n=1 Tax=Niallia hominis TaxID=3133173 RepID=A0ABV1F4P6_9BACI
MGTTNTNVLNKKAYLVNVQAYYHNDAGSPDNVEKEKLVGPRGLSAKSSDVYATISTNGSLVGLEDYFTYGTHLIGTTEVSVNVTTGNLTLSQTDHSLFTKGDLGFDFTRYYNSKSTQASVLGKGWSFEGSEYLIKSPTNNNFYLWDEDGTRHEFVYNSTTNTFTSPKGKYLTLQDTTLNNRAAFALTDKSGFIKVFETDPTTANKYRLYSYRDGNNNQILFKYADNQLREIAEVDSNNTTIRRSISLVYKNGMLFQTNYVDRTVEYLYNEENQLSDTIIKATGTTKTITNSLGYDGVSGLLTEYIDAKDNENSISYSTNEINILTPQADGKESVETTYQFNNDKNEYTVLDTSGKETTYKRDISNKTFAVTDTINSDGTSSKSTYDSNYNELTVTDENGKTESTAYYENGNVKYEIEKDGKQTQYVKYDDKNQLLEKVDPDGIKTVNVYNGYNLTSTTVGEEVTSYEYDGIGRVTKVTNPNNTYTQTVYDEANKRITVTDAKGVTSSSYYNNYGQVVKDVDGENRSQSYTFDVLYPDLKTSVTDGNGSKTTYEYDDNGNMTSLIDALGRKKTYTYNGNDELLTSSFPKKGTSKINISSEYDENGNVQKVTQHSGITESYQYDEVDLLKQVTVKNKNGISTFEWNQTYDDAGQLETLTFKDIAGNRSITKSYGYTADNLVKTYTQGKYVIDYVYDSLNRVDNQTLKYNESIDPISIKQDYDYTDEGKMKKVVSEMDSESNKMSLDYTYNLKQNKAAVSYHNGLMNSDYQYDGSNNLTKIAYLKNSQSFLSYSYSYDKSGNVKSETNKDGTSTYAYDGNNQLVKEVLANGAVNEYSYDKVGNRVSFKQNGQEISSYTYNEANQVETKNNSIAFTYDEDGNLTKDDSYTYMYNDMSVLSSISTVSGSLVAKYEYDEEGLRTKKVVGSKTYEYYYDGEEDNLTLEVISVNNQIQQYRYYQWDTFGKAVGMTIKQKAQDGTWKTAVYYFLTNQRGDVSSIVDTTGVEVGSYSYDAYGNLLSETGTIAKENNIRYASYYYDQETKHYYLKARYYDPVNGIFQALDPHPGDEDDPVSQNGYTYGGNNPVINVDPDGDFFWMAVNVGFAAYDGYKAYKAGGSAGKIAGAAALGFVGGSKFKALKKASHAVYTLNKGGKVVYVGRTKNIKARAKSHSKVHSDATFNIEKKGLTYAQARGLEHRLYLKNGGKKNLRNKIRPISQKNKKYKQYMSVSRSVYR